MRQLPLYLLLAGLPCLAFAGLGMLTHSGRRAFVAMAGMVPLGFGVVGVVLVAGALTLWWLRRATPR
jgi:hypothetical protein